MRTVKIRIVPVVIGFIYLFVSCNKEEDLSIDPIWADVQEFTNKEYNSTYIYTPHCMKMMIKFKDDVTENDLENFASSYNLVCIKENKYEDICYGTFLIPTEQKLENVGSRILQDKNVEDALPIYIDQNGYDRSVIPGRFVVLFRDTVADSTCEQIISEWDLEILRDYYSHGMYALSLPTGMNVFDAIREYMKMEEVKFTSTDEFVEIVPHD